MIFPAVLKGNYVVLPLACCAALAMLVISEVSYWYSSRTTRESLAVVDTQKLISKMHSQLLDAETGQRGYLLTGSKHFLVPYNESASKIEQHFLQLNARYENRPDCKDLLQQLKTATDEKFRVMATTLAIYEPNQSKASVDLVLIDSGRTKMQEIRRISDALIMNEEVNLTNSQGKMHEYLALSRFSVALLTLIAFIALYFYLRRAYQLKSHQVKLKNELTQERDTLETAVLNRTKELTLLARYLQTNREDERNRLARNLHDDLGALLTSAKLDAARITSRVGGTLPEVNELLGHLVGNLNGSIALGRKIIEDLRPSALSNLGLVPTLEILAREFTHNSHLPVHTAFTAVYLSADSELMIYRLMQEACTNIMKYSKASQVWMSLGLQDGMVVASVRDDGIGFDTSRKLGASYGLLGMRYRVEAASGTLHIASTLGAGTLIRATLSPDKAPPV